MSSDYSAKVREVVAMLSGAYRREAGIVVYTAMSEDPELARARLQRFVQDMFPDIEASLEQSFASGKDPNSPP